MTSGTFVEDSVTDGVAPVSSEVSLVGVTSGEDPGVSNVVISGVILEVVSVTFGVTSGDSDVPGMISEVIPGSSDVEMGTGYVYPVIVTVSDVTMGVISVSLDDNVAGVISVSMVGVTSGVDPDISDILIISDVISVPVFSDVSSVGVTSGETTGVSEVVISGVISDVVSVIFGVTSGFSDVPAIISEVVTDSSDVELGTG